ncbi:TPA: hypothetical protein ACN34R_000687 [Vibrio parahaemolyticus]|nr:hypothetical protein [Vibrio parahaemolyticus]EKZ9248950.1 hypothetical protein [Vibrio parahaemolyticus]ELA6677395.1 hypothetical protein [Vibrio parahaemolyticus]ELI6470706.1 hypothetical protein [Vibrio parahaemolyticus]
MYLNEFVSKKTGNKLLVKELSTFSGVPVSSLQNIFNRAQELRDFSLISRLVSKAEQKKAFMFGAVDEAKESLRFELMKLVDAVESGNAADIALYYAAAEKAALTYKPHDEDTKNLIQAFEHIRDGFDVAKNKDFLLFLIHPELTIHNGELMIREIVEGKGA